MSQNEKFQIKSKRILSDFHKAKKEYTQAYRVFLELDEKTRKNISDKILYIENKSSVEIEASKKENIFKNKEGFCHC